MSKSPTLSQSSMIIIVSNMYELSLTNSLGWLPVAVNVNKPSVLTPFLFKYKSMLFLAAVGLAGWLASSYFKKKKLKSAVKIVFFPDNGKSDLAKFKNMPGLPVFASVSVGTVKFGSILVPDPMRRYQISKKEFPSLYPILTYGDFVVCYNRIMQVPHWVFEHLTKRSRSMASLTEIGRTKCVFTQDESVRKCFRAAISDNKKSGFDRGHLAAAGNRLMDLKLERCNFTNLEPQVGERFNHHFWNILEEHVRQVIFSYRNIYVCTGPLYLPKSEPDGKKNGTSQVAVPTHFFKVIIMETERREFHLESYIIPYEANLNKYSSHVENFYAPPENIESSADLLFFDELTRKRLVMINGVKANCPSIPASAPKRSKLRALLMSSVENVYIDNPLQELSKAWKY